MKKFIFSLSLVLVSSFSFSQIDLESVLEGGTADAQTYLRGYLEPVAVGFSNGINGGWYSTARSHKLFGFDIAIIANATLVPESAETFTFANSDYTNIKLDADTSAGASAELPTFFGSQDLSDRPLLEFTNSDGNKLSTSSLPGSGLKDAINYNIVPSAMVQVGVGLFKNTDLKVRFIPQLSTDDYEFSNFGIGIMHDIKQWIPVVNRLPFSLSVFGGYNNLKSKFFIDPDNNPDRALEFNTKTWMFQLLASKKLSIFTVYGGLGTTSYDTDVNVLGRYSVSGSTNVIEDPLGLAYDGSDFRANLGLSIKLLVLKISADYAFQEYETFTVTAGFTFR